jgi:hypothetical protein
MKNCVGKLTASAVTSLRRELPAIPVQAPQAERSAFNELPNDLKKLIVGRLDPESKKTLRLTNRSFRQVGAERLTKLEIPATELGTLDSLLRGLPYVRTVTISDLDDAGLAQLAAMSPTTRDKITHIRLRDSITNAGLASLQGLTQLQSLGKRPRKASCTARFNGLKLCGGA